MQIAEVVSAAQSIGTEESLLLALCHTPLCHTPNAMFIARICCKLLRLGTARTSENFSQEDQEKRLLDLLVHRGFIGGWL
jgi:hypothetical protein